MRPVAATDPAPIDAATTDRARARAAATGLATRAATRALLAAGLALVGCGDAGRDAGAAGSRADAGTDGSTAASVDPARGTSDGTSDGARDDAPRAMSARELIDATDAVEKLLNAERTDEAVIVARRLLERAPAGSDAAATAGEIAARALFTHAQMQAAALAPPERAALLAEAADCAERSVADGQADAGKIAFAALLNSSAGRADRARQLFDRALELAPTDAQTLLQAALSSLAQGDLARTRDLIARRRAAGAGTGSNDGWNDGLEAEAALSAGDPSAAVAAAQRAVAANRDALEFRLILARALRRAGRAGDAARLLSALEAEARAKPAIAEQFALALGESGDLAGAARAWDAALRASPADPFVRAEAALAFHRAGDTARAAAELAALDAMKGGAAQRRRVAELMRPAG